MYPLGFDISVFYFCTI